MIIPVRCFSCGRVIASDYVRFRARMDEIRALGREPAPEEVSRALDELGLHRYCCRRMILSHVDLIDDVMPFS
ncbi:DNA-directed RNA polymerase subunit N [Thermogymnomonas acidicola]|uniref:DNA-directed RNA polymerase subunit Rpo10 n=1 Tax=Thermogymnomonas acidicola TaxID=399579 RepID=A0AA37F9H6_9ARCH|nr:DNA-directed RNA polymerase subunit N [Thermogymnomonas acidicola]GGM73162.1 DNA-directed RNA polymerase subunit N [Thermogymnomonas acidicola]